MLKLVNASKSYQMGDVLVKALDNVSLEIQKGEFLAIMGPSGSGKSTLMNLLGLLDVPDQGAYYIEGKNSSELSDNDLAELRGKTIGFIFQQFHLLSHLSAQENVVMPQLYTFGSFDRQRAKNLLEQVGLGDRAHHKPSELSGGQQQRVAIARSMVNDPLLILADEPTGNLDSRSEREILDYLRFLNTQGVTVVIVTHNEHIGKEANRLIRMRDGQIYSDETLVESTRPEPKAHAHFEQKGLASLYRGLVMNLRQGIANLSGHKLRTFLSTLGITIGVASVVAIISGSNGFRALMDKEMKIFEQNIFIVSVGRNLSGSATMNSIHFTRDTVRRLELALPGPKVLVPIKMASGKLSYQNKSSTQSIVGVGKSFFKMHGMETEQGAFFDDDVKADERVVVLGSEIAKELFEDQDPIGRSMKINGTEFEIVGVMKNPAFNTFGDRKSAFLPIDVVMSRVSASPFIDVIEISTDPKMDIAETTMQIQENLGEIHKVPLSTGKDAFSITNMNQFADKFNAVMIGISLFLAFVASISLLVGGIGIVNIMLVSVSERTKEIGLRKALGAKRSAIFVQFLIESKYICLLGGLAGTALSWLTCVIINLSTDKIHVEVSIETVLFACGFSILVGLISGIYPARRASKLHPIEALRTL